MRLLERAFTHQLGEQVALKTGRICTRECLGRRFTLLACSETGLPRHSSYLPANILAYPAPICFATFVAQVLCTKGPGMLPLFPSTLLQRRSKICRCGRFMSQVICIGRIRQQAPKGIRWKFAFISMNTGRCSVIEVENVVVAVLFCDTGEYLSEGSRGTTLLPNQLTQLSIGNPNAKGRLVL